ncbi:MAG: cytochrome c biogenesis CcdA family protein [Gemmatimonadaceae bacterium]
MEPASSVGLAVSFTAGLLSFLSPCVLPLIPSYVTFITGMSLDDVVIARRRTLVHALLFIAGFTLIFLALGAGATALGSTLRFERRWLSRVGGVLIIVFGLYLLGVLKIGAFMRERRIHLADKPLGYLGTVLVGMTFGAGWTPCIGPILSAILVYTSSEADLSRGMMLLSAYSLGLAVPFVIAAVAIDRFINVVKAMRRHLVWVSRVSGLLLIAVGLLMVTDRFTILASYLQSLTPDFLRERL